MSPIHVVASTSGSVDWGHRRGNGRICADGCELVASSGAVLVSATSQVQGQPSRCGIRSGVDPPLRPQCHVGVPSCTLEAVRRAQLFPGALGGPALTQYRLVTPLLFGAQKSRSALVDVVALWLTLLALVRESRKIDRAASNLLLPYLGWVTFATYLNYAIVKKNPNWLRAKGALPDRVTQSLRHVASPLLHS